MASSEKYVNGRDKLIAKNPALFYSNRFKRVVYDFSKPWTMISGISKDQFNLAKNDQQLLSTYFPYKEMSAKNKYSGFDYLKGNVYLSYNDFTGFFLRCSNNSGVQAHSDYIHGDFIASVDFGLLWSQLDIDIVNSTKGLYSYSDIYNDQRSLWIAPRDSACDRANFIFKDNCLSNVNGFSLPTVYTFNLNDVPDIHDDLFNNGIYTESEAQGYKGEMFNFKYPRSISELSSKSDDELTNMTLEDYTFTKGVVSIKFTDNANDSVNPKTPTVFIETVGDVYSKRAKMTAFNIHTGTGRMFTISVPEEYYINAVFFLGALGLGHGLLVNGKIVPNNLTPNGIVNDTSLPICPIEDTESIWKANSNNLTSVSFADIATSGGSHTISAIYVSYAKKGEALIPPNIFNIDTGKNSLKVVDLGLHAMWASCNLGATNEAECGSYFQWGTGHKGTNFDITESSWYNAATGEFVKIDNVDIGETSYDAATQMLGNPWRIPNEASISELVNSCTWTETSNGYRVKGPNGNEIFLPFTGYHNGTNLENKDRLFYWSSSYDDQSSHANDHYAWMLTNSMENGKTKITVPSDYIIKGMCIRPIIYVNQMPDTPTVEDTSESVDLGLSVKWARHNIGATEKTDSGNHYAWGSVQTSDIYNQDSYEWYDASTSEYKIPATNIAGTKYDVATQTLGGKWRIPTEDEFNELINKCTWVATDDGFRIIGTNGNEIFLPFTGMCMGNEQVSSDKMYYWSCNYNTLPLHKEDHWAYYLTNYTSSGEVNPVVISSYVYNGMCIRPVMDNSFTPNNPTETKKAIDLGLSVKWANQNIKSSSDISKDAFFSWGNINEQLYYNRNSYPYLNKNIDNNGVLPLDKDVAVQRWGDKWRMPTITEWNELINQCTWSETTKNGVKGYNVTGNGNTIFFPLSGLINDDGKAFENEQGEYWTSECVVNNTNNYTDAYGATLTPNSNPHYFISGSNERYIGHTVRPVYDETFTPNTPDKPSSSYDGEDRQKLINEYSIAFKSNHYKKYVFDFSKPWELFNTKSEKEFKENIDNVSFFDKNANFKNTHFDGDFSFNYWKGDTKYDWSDYLNSFFLRFIDGSGFKVRSNAHKGYFISAIDFGTKYSQVDLVKERAEDLGMGSGVFSIYKTLWVGGSYSHSGVNFYYRNPSFLEFNGLSKVTLYGFNLDDVPEPGSKADYGRYNNIQAKGYKEAMFNFMRPYTLDLFANKQNEDIAYTGIQDKVFKNDVVSVSFTFNPTSQIVNKISAQLNIPYADNLYYKDAEVPVYSALIGDGGMFTISVKQGYEIKSIVFEKGLSQGISLYVDGNIIYGNTDDFVGNTSLPIYPTDDECVVWLASKNGLTSVSFAQNGAEITNDIYAIYVGYVKEGEAITPSTIPSLPDNDEHPSDIKGNTGNIDVPNNPNIPNIPDVPKDDIDTPVSSKALRFIDTNETGYSVDPNVILYAGGQEVIPQTMTQKDNTLFLGNYKESNRVFSQEDIDFIRNNSKAYFTMDISPAISKGEIGSLYMYDNQLKKSSYDIASFKGGEVYRFGLVFQNKRGEWSDIIYVGDEKNDLYPKDYGTYFRAPKAQITISPSAVARLYDMGYRKAKAVVVYPSMNNRLTVCQGVMCPTVYNINSRKNNAPYAMSSWFYREMHGQSINIVGTQNRHNYNIYNDINDYIPLKDRVLPSNNNFSVFKLGKGSISQFRAEISCADINNYYAYNSDDSQNMYVDWNTVTMNTPEVDFSIENSSNSIPTENLKLRIVGVIPLTSNANDIYVNTSTQPIKVASFTGFHNTNDNHNNIDYNAGTPRLTKFDWYDYDYHQDTNKERTDWDINKQHFETSEDYDLTRDQAFQQAFKQDIKGLKVYADHKVYPLFPWQGAKSLVGQYSVKEDNGMVYSALKKKVISNIRTSAFTYYFPEKSLSYGISNVGLYSGDIPLSKLSSDKNDVDHAGLFNYYGEVDTILSPKNYYQIYHGLLIDYDLNSYNQGALEEVSKILPIGKTNDPVRMKYKSSPHLACHLNYTKDGKQELLPKFKLRNFIFGDQADGDAVTKAGTFNGKYYIAGWSDRILDNTANRENMSNVTSLHQNTIDLSYPTLPLFSTMDYMSMGFMYIGEFYKDDPKDLSSIFGGTTPMAFEKNQWHTAGPTMLLKKGMGVTVNCLQGDTYYQRYDSLKTYPYTDEDPNQIVEILSFMCETRMNIDGRYDNNRGLSSNLYMNKVNFNLFNPAYTQQDNFFNYYFLDPERNNNDTYPNDFIWTKAKTMGEEIDTWSNISSSASYSLDGDKGSLNSIINYNDSLLTFQDTGIAKIMYNDRVQVAASDGIPIELANSQKVSGKQYLSNTIGCNNKKTIQITPNGVYFMDGNSKDLYTLGNGINSLTKAKGFNNYLYDKNISKFKTFYDKKLKDVYFINDENCLDFNEQLNEFEGFYDYEGTDYMFSYNDSFISIKNGSIWKQYVGDYNTFYGKYKPFWLTLISNDGNVDKTFNTVEFEADSWDKDNNLMSDTFDHLSAWDEYQIGESNLRALNINNHYHFSNLKRKFRVWRANIPRELKLKNMSFVNALAKIQEGNINNTTGKVLNMTEGLNRIRNTWAYIRLKKNNENKNKTVLHSVKVSYLY